MPVTIKKSQLMYKNPSTGEYVSVDAVADKTSQQQINGINTAASNAIASINTAMQDIDSQPLTTLPKKAYKKDLVANEETLASAAAHAYAVGDYFFVADNNNDISLYKATAAIAVGATISPGTGIDNNCVPAALADDVTSLSNDIDTVKADLDALESGLSDTAKSALLACFTHVAWADEDGQDYYDALESALYPPANLSYITCAYTQGGTVYDNYSLDSLKNDLVVTAHYDDSSSELIDTYVLSGTLTAGTSTITVSYGGKTTTFDVTVAHIDNTLLYSLPQTTVFDGSSTVVNTGVAPFSTDSDFSIVATFKANVTQNKFCSVWASGDGNNLLMLRPTDATTGVWRTYGGGKLSSQLGADVTITSDNDVVRYIFRHKIGQKYEVFASVNGTTTVNGTELGSAQMKTTAIEVRLGKSYANNTYFTGTVSDFLIYSRALNDTEIATYLAGGE